MRKPWSISYRRFASLICAFLLSANAYAGVVLEPPQILPFRVEKLGAKVDVQLRVTKNQEYIFGLDYHFKKDDQIDRMRVRHLEGEMQPTKNGVLVTEGYSSGVRSPFIFRIYEINAGNERLILEKEYQELWLTTWGVDYFTKNFAYVVLNPGLYRIYAESLEDAPALHGTQTSLSIGYVLKR